jgi:tripartite-type tricarboxylate transporter receptor subunit TctC
MKFPRRKFLQLAAGGLALPAVARSAHAQAYPSRPVTMIVSFPAGGANDAIARIVAEPLRIALGQPIIIENVGGADGSVGVGRLARARPDGYTVCLGIDTAFVHNGAYHPLTYDLLNDFEPITPVATAATILVARKDLPAANLSEFIAWSKANPNQASAGMNALAFRLVAVRLQRETGAQFAIVPYRAAPSMLTDLIAGRLDLAFGTLTSHGPNVRAGDYKALALGAQKRNALAPEIPTYAEQGLAGLTYVNWYGLFAPKGVPKEIVSRLAAATAEALADPATRARLANGGFEPFPAERQTTAALAALQKADVERWWPIIKELGLKPE